MKLRNGLEAVLLLACLLAGRSALAQLPVPPCAGSGAASLSPAYGALDQQPNVVSAAGAALKGWKPRCGGSTRRAPNLALGLAGTFRHEGDARSLLERAGAVSTLKGVRYWSVTDHEWRVLVSDASALAGEKGPRRGDFSEAEMATKTNLYFTQTDTRSNGEVTYRVRVLELQPDRLVIETDNTSVVRFLFLPLFQPGDLHTVNFLERRGPGVWGYYSLVLANTPRAEGSQDSFINRAAALYRHFIGVPDDTVPPLAP